MTPVAHRFHHRAAAAGWATGRYSYGLLATLDMDPHEPAPSPDNGLARLGGRQPLANGGDSPAVSSTMNTWSLATAWVLGTRMWTGSPQQLPVCSDGASLGGFARPVDLFRPVAELAAFALKMCAPNA